MNSCPTCHTENDDASTYCRECGSSLGGGVEETVTATTAGVQSGALDESIHSADAHFFPGLLLAGRYRIVSLVGKGGMGDVYRADDLKLRQQVALKFLPDGITLGSRKFELFLNEVRLSRQVAHPNVCRVYDIAEADGRHFLSMEFIDGEDLKTLLRRIGRLPLDKGMQIAQQICAGLAAAHQKGVLHRDLKPANIMIDGQGQARVTDFGIARLTSDDGQEGAFAGTPAYAAPEQRKHGKTSVQSDLYSLGLLLAELLTGEKPIGDDAPSRLEQAFDRLELPSGASNAIRQCLEPTPQDRPQSALEISAAIPGGDSLAAALKAGRMPSPELVASSGAKGHLRRSSGWILMGGMSLSLVICLFLEQETYQINQGDPIKHPEILRDTASKIVGRLGYESDMADSAYGFRWSADKELRFWFRQRPGELINSQFLAAAGGFSFSRVSESAPAWDHAGELGLELDVSGNLLSFRCIPPQRESRTSPATEVDWSRWFSPEWLGRDVAGFLVITNHSLIPPDAYDQSRLWQSPERADGHLQRFHAAALNGRLTYFQALGSSLFSPNEWEDYAGFIKSMVGPDRAVDEWLSSLLSTKLLDLMEGQADGGALVALKSELNGIVRTNTVFSPKRFKDVALRAETKALLSAEPSGLELERLNRLLLEDAYPQSFARSSFANSGIQDRIWIPESYPKQTATKPERQLPVGLFVIVGAFVLVLRNLILRRHDIKGANRVFKVFLLLGVVEWLTLARYSLSPDVQLATIYVGLATALFCGGYFWLVYIGFEPFIRRYWPQSLISWTRLLRGSWRDPLVGYHLLAGSVFGAGSSIVLKLVILARRTFQTNGDVSSFDLAVHFAPYFTSSWGLLSQVAHELRLGTFIAFSVLSAMVLFRSMMVRYTVVGLCSVVLLTLAFQYSGPLDVVSMIIWMSMVYGVLIRFGLLSGVVFYFVGSMLNAPLTTDFDLWYSSMGISRLALVFALGALGFLISQGRNIALVPK